MERVLGIGGYFVKAEDPKALMAWSVSYTHLTLPTNREV